MLQNQNNSHHLKKKNKLTAFDLRVQKFKLVIIFNIYIMSEIGSCPESSCEGSSLEISKKRFLDYFCSNILLIESFIITQWNSYPMHKS